MSNMDEWKELLKLVEQSSIQRFEHETTRIVIVKNDGSQQKSVKVNVVTPDGERIEHAVPGAEVDPKPVQPKADADAGLHVITSPTMGTYYSSPKAGSEPFVTVGQQVNASTIVCVLEAMKLFTEIPAGVEGEIVETLVQDGDFVQYGQPLFRVRKEG